MQNENNFEKHEKLKKVEDRGICPGDCRGCADTGGVYRLFYNGR